VGLQYPDDKAGLLALVIQFTLDGKPLRDAEVTLVPESFLGAAVKPAQGKTNAGGACVEFRTEGAEFPGVHPGVFRLVVSKHWVQVRGQQRLSTSPYGRTALPEEWQPFHWMRDSKDARLRWLWERMLLSTRPDCSDAGMAWFVVTGMGVLR
jgi:hypothetical protein